ncbi:methionyl-tRNA formyltransferase [Flavobacterium johnsoniae]|uniref:Methionyl-tRNA formyltransferase n=1 Tax=Flavobacterium johnsoniae (strain ATCC 17061 / DSM 2064 / JCM 8514 / BCRC 14874 / CCUG 350202 / NBRC 14942 / NCIMB 11054 / UW101) TaxID=376686 RepID=FMT_FLAJ1|nr:methionyl-tRNA formyltransferase [Flavobacterium johnsoniae]A5FNN7.1 RecName: Full=Methionyl-tRNA formyltransferase [Flavobacterium johnsoniae UW101]ABQ03176.1 methionyl-tRNA formyltransferase [Flavobacterium johnsoniae UW101]OXG01396.1 methionyl-tRNA formyltransferase [Flavobacterium johnsoniae UW101]WQG79963.1 methionyl-tRNA formyltransferase [Flavobacterium johnsoniae UW101]SHL83011.1 methionyl-tRNA formyltransferase [Flavobacterium johnsoniae]
MEKLRIIFMGTPEFAVGILDTIIKNNYDVVGVITAADKPAGRGQKIKYSAVKEYALANNLTLLQPTNLKDESFLAELKALNANLQIVVAFRMLPKVVWEMPNLGTFNLHASLLPNYRGAAPINWAIINGETKTGVTTFFIDDKIDTGAMILNSEIAIEPAENAGQLHDRLMNLGSTTVIDTLKVIENGNVITTIQEDNNDIKTAYKLNKENCKIDWTKSGDEINNLIRGLSPYPAAWCFLKDKNEELSIKIYEAKLLEEAHSYEAGKLISGKKEIKIAIKNGFIQLLSLQLPGKKRMQVAELLNGITFSDEAKVY